MDVLLTHGYFLNEDPHELAVMKPYPPLGLLYISSHLKARGFSVDVFDTTFASPSQLEAHIQRTRPPVVGIYSNLMTRRNILPAIRQAKEGGGTVVLGGPDPANYLAEYLDAGADAIVIGEGELTLEELLTEKDFTGIKGIAYRGAGGAIVRNEPRPMIANLDAQPFPDRAAID